MAESDSGEKTEEPTQRRLEKAQEEGQVFRSQEFSVALLVVASVLLLTVLGPGLVRDLVEIFALNMDLAGLRDERYMAGRFMGSVGKAAPYLLVVLVATSVVALLGNVLMGGLRINPRSILPKPDKLNPFAGLKRMFGAQALYELVKGMLKALLILAATVFAFVQARDQVFLLGSLPGKAGIAAAGEILGDAVLLIASTLVLIAMLDVPVKIMQFREKLMMSRYEVKEEFRQSEGRPEIRSRIRQRQREIALNKMMQAVEKADVVVTNPQHFAVALSYTPGSSAAPKVLGKGVDFIALRIRSRAEELGIPVFEAPALARALYFTSRIEEEIPEPLYYAVAEVIAYVFSLGVGRNRGRAPKRPDPVVPDDLLFDSDGKPARPGGK